MTNPFLLRTVFRVLTLTFVLSISGYQAEAAKEPVDRARQQLSALARRLQDESQPRPVHVKALTRTYRNLARFARRHESDPWGPLAALALGYRDFQLERYAEAEEWFRRAALAGQGPTKTSAGVQAALGDYARWYQAQSLAAQKKYEAASETLADFPEKYPDSLLLEAVVEKRAAWWLDAGQAEKAIRSLIDFHGTIERPSLLAVLARAYEAANQPAQAAETLQRIYYDLPLNGEAVGSELLRLKAQLGEKLPKVLPARRMGRAETLYAAGRSVEAQAEYEELAQMTAGDEKDHVLVRMGACLFQQGQPERAIEVLAGIARADGPFEAERLYYLSQSYRTLDRENEMLAIVEQAGRKLGANPWLEEVLFATGNYYLLKNNDAQATEYYRRVAESFPSGRYAERARWKVAWNAYLTGSPDASALLSEFVMRYPDSSQVPDALYWMGRIKEKENYDLARPFYDVLARRFPHHYFSQDAQRRLQAAGGGVSTEPPPDWFEKVPGVAKFPDNSASVPEAGRWRWQRYQDLRLIALDDLALDELRAASRAAPAAVVWLELARSTNAKGLAWEAIDALWRYYPDFLGHRTEEIPLNIWRMLFPLLDEGLIRKWCKKYRLDPLLVAALIRQESAFNEQAVSNVGAVGLMQLMPATAGRLAGERRQRFRPVRLTNPDYNIDYGCYYLAQLMKMFKESSGSQRLQGGFELALAAYNAGEEAVQRWLETRPAEDVQTFVENIPYTQTREYVQIILRNHKIYREIYRRR